MKALELFAGAGGLALGMSEAGFEHVAVVERDNDACNTIRRNNSTGVIDWPLIPGDVRTVDFRALGPVDVVAGGPPCQPFSIGGKHRGQTDDRNLFPEAIRAIRETSPSAVLIENVKGLLRPAFSAFFDYVLLQIQYPGIVRKQREDWQAHLERLRKLQSKGRSSDLNYNVAFRCVNAADYGVPQRRERVLIVAFRTDIDARWSFPAPTHSRDALLRDQWVTGDYWERHAIPRRIRPAGQMSPVRLRQVSLRFEEMDNPPTLPWRTVRDALSGLPEPKLTPCRFDNHILNPGARTYAGHTGSPLDEPAKTLKAGDHGVPGGENMLLYPDGSVRYFTVRESARLQTFPDEYVLDGSWTESMRQLGNAVPVALGAVVGRSIADSLKTSTIALDDQRLALQPA